MDPSRRSVVEVVVVTVISVTFPTVRVRSGPSVVPFGAIRRPHRSSTVLAVATAKGMATAMASPTVHRNGVGCKHT